MAQPKSASAEQQFSALPRLGFLGTGWIGRRRLEAIVEAGAAEIVVIADPVPDNIEKALGVAPAAARADSFEEVLRHELDGIVIATPSALHAQQTIAALQRGRAVFCQKPLGRTAEEVREIIAVAQRADRLLGVDLSYRHAVALAKIREIVRSGDLGEVFSVELVFHNAYGPQPAWFYDARLSGGGCVVDLESIWSMPHSGCSTHRWLACRAVFFREGGRSR